VDVEEILERKLLAMTKPFSNRSGLLPGITLGSGGEMTRMKGLKVQEKVRSSMTVFAVPKQNVFRPSLLLLFLPNTPLLVPTDVGGTPHVHHIF
jgi:hypothetical protein